MNSTVRVLGVQSGKYIKTATFDVDDKVKDYLISKVRSPSFGKAEKLLKLNEADKKVYAFYGINNSDVDLYMVLAIKHMAKTLNTQRIHEMLGQTIKNGLHDLYIAKEDFQTIKRFAKYLFENPNLKLKDVEIPTNVESVFRKIVKIRLLDKVNLGLHNELGAILSGEGSYEQRQLAYSRARKAYIVPKVFHIPDSVLNEVVFNEAILMYKSVRRFRRLLSNKIPNEYGMVYFNSIEEIPEFIKTNISEHVSTSLLLAARRKTKNVKSLESVLRKVFHLDPSRIFPEEYENGTDVYAIYDYSIKPFGYTVYSSRVMALDLKDVSGIKNSNGLIEFNAKTGQFSGHLMEALQNVYDVKMKFPAKASKISKSVRSIRFENIRHTRKKVYYDPVQIVLHSKVGGKNVRIVFDVHAKSTNSKAYVNSPLSLLYYIDTVL